MLANGEMFHPLARILKTVSRPAAGKQEKGGRQQNPRHANRMAVDEKRSLCCLPFALLLSFSWS
jgi:hypothetical protein